jgi:hypothetical protein
LYRHSNLASPLRLFLAGGSRKPCAIFACFPSDRVSRISIATGPAAMDASFAVFIVGSCVSFALFYWAFARRYTAARGRQPAGRALPYGNKKSSFLDDLRHEAGLRAQAVLDAAVDQASKPSRSGISIDAEMVNRLRETRSMLQSLLPHEFTSEFDHIVRLLQAPPSVRKHELDAALERFERKVANIGAPERTPARPAARRRSPFLFMQGLSAPGDAS